MRLLVMTEGKPFGAKDAASTPPFNGTGYLNIRIFLGRFALMLAG